VSPAERVFVLDSYAVLAYLNAEPGQVQVSETLALAQDNHCQVILCHISLGEVLYITERRRGLTHAQRVLALVESLPLLNQEISRNLVLDAAHIKAQYPISYADSFVVATAQRTKGTILTGDPEFKTVEDLVNIIWLG